MRCFSQQQIDTSNPLGKGGFGTVYKALNLETGDFVAIKQVKLGNIPKDQLNSIMVGRIIIILVFDLTELRHDSS